MGDGADAGAGVDGTSPLPLLAEAAEAPPPAAWAAKLEGMPRLARRLLVAHEVPSAICPMALLREVCSAAPYAQYRASKAAIEGGGAATVLRLERALDAAACAALRAALDERGTSTIDSVDRMQEHVLYSTRSELEGLIGAEAVAALLAIPRRFAASAATAGDEAGAAAAAASYELFDCFLRRYSADTAGDQLLTSFHADSAALTVNVALTSDEAVEGGRLLGVYDGAIRVITRAEGDATAHSSALLHGVTRMHKGTRYSMIMFFARQEGKYTIG
jgi:predicted 2-oxoglutarate/Fe(II)-dependent dioxygenase YbiX